MDFIIENPDYLLLLLGPVFVAVMLLEWLLMVRKGKLPKSADYELRETFSNFVLGGLHQASDVLFGLLVIKIYVWLYGWQLFDIEMSVSNFLILLVAQDFCYYWFHRASHRIRWFWAAHSTHHSSKNMNFSTAFRQSLMYPVAGMWMFWLPLVIIGFPPNWVIFAVLLNLALQFFIHTQWIKNFGVFDLIFNSPSHHRVHHGCNPQYIDKNYAGVLIIWDRMFGTFEPEVETVEYGITKPVDSGNPIASTFDEWRDMLKEATDRDASIRERLGAIFAPPKESDRNI
ncbi:sterol desaturase family protein [Veronia pacifica]|uniref:Sterol desaturase n=1 Tax=Veronia pacifica TaxID=1080227 RepID=A0A1C3EML9_9GAMM|nr:sterol desaturase family protein [Veronia pacifica]ODA34459.1 sterol desaturase [Veronia pacifica]